MDSVDDDVEYTFNYLTTINFESKFIMIADAPCEKVGPDLLKDLRDIEQGGDHENDYKAIGPIRNKENWDVYLKYRHNAEASTNSSSNAPELISENDDIDASMELVDIILINKKLLRMLPEKTLEDKMNELSWECDSKITLSSYMLAIFDCQHFNNKESYSIPDDGDGTWYELMYTTMMGEKKDILDADHGVLFFLQNDTYGIYQIVDDIDKQILAINFEVIPNNHWSTSAESLEDNGDDVADNSDDKTWSILSSNYLGNRPKTSIISKEASINNSNIKTI